MLQRLVLVEAGDSSAEGRKDWLETERLVIERGDNFAATNGKYFRVEDITRELSAIRSSINTARDQMETAHE